MALIFVIADYVRHQLGLGRYQATELEAKRFVEELRVYEREAARFQLEVSDEETTRRDNAASVKVTVSRQTRLK